MFVLRSATACAALLGAAMLISPAAVSAAPLGLGLSAGLSDAPASHVQQVQNRARVRPARPGPRHRGGHRHHRGGGGRGDAVAVGVGIGILGGIIAAGAAAAAADSAAVDACARRYRSYNPHTRTFRGYDGIEYSCP